MPSALEETKVTSFAWHPSAGLGSAGLLSHVALVVRPYLKFVVKSDFKSTAALVSVKLMTASAAITRKSASDTTLQKSLYTSCKVLLNTSGSVSPSKLKSPLTQLIKPLLSGSSNLMDADKLGVARTKLKTSPFADQFMTLD